MNIKLGMTTLKVINDGGMSLESKESIYFPPVLSIEVYHIRIYLTI